MSQGQEENAVTVMWDFFCSLKLTIVTLIVLAVTSIVGTILKQGQSMQEYVQERFGRNFPDGFPANFTQAEYDQMKEGFESTYRFFDAMYFFDMYHSWWFVALLGIFAMNLICCSIKRFPRVMKIVREPNRAPDDKFYRTMSNVDEIDADGSLEMVQEKVTKVVSDSFAGPSVNNTGDAVHLFSQKAAYARFGVYVTHLSILVILVGAIIGVQFGYKGYVQINEGETIDKVVNRAGNNWIPLDFSIRCDDFTVTYYQGSTRPKDFTSDLVVFENGQEILRKTIEVNDPLQYKGITFYQSSYGPAGNPTYRFRVKERATGETVEISGPENAHIPIPGGASLIPMQYTESFRNFGPAAQVNIDTGTPDNHQHGTPFIVMQNFPDFDNQRDGTYIITLLGVEQAFYTGLQVAKDPGVWVVWVGCTLMVVGSMVAFFLSHRRIWVTLRQEGGKVKVKFAGNAHRNQPAFAIWFDEFKEKMKAELAS